MNKEIRRRIKIIDSLPSEENAMKNNIPEGGRTQRTGVRTIHKGDSVKPRTP
ncbi:hypothetical protein [Thermoplasma acidophilum]|uniref:hypothetical protein n=1 Tax=Thermoplasma acidophilum TaxID=2303 RepID=UPI001389FE17|nr:hypothetical protein [Thermoplasma acidophilum]